VTAAQHVQAFPVRGHLIPFITRVLYHGAAERHQPTEWPIPAGDKDLYTADDLDALRQIFAQGVLYAFSHHAKGWGQRPVLVGGDPQLAQARSLRLWEATSAWGMEFSASSPVMCEALYNLSLRKPAKDDAQKKEREKRLKDDLHLIEALNPTATGDAALLYWLWSGLGSSPGELPAEEASAVKEELREWALGRQPMLALRHGPWGKGEAPSAARFEALMRGPARGLLPWWCRHALGHWQAREDGLVALPAARFAEVRARQAAILGAWVQAAEATGWLHLLCPVVEFFDVQARWLRALGVAQRPASVHHDAWQRVTDQDKATPESLAEAALARLGRAYQGQRNQERQALREAWAGLWCVAGQLRWVYERRVVIHHADREANDTFFVSWGSEQGLGARLEHLEAVARAVEGRLG
jgi:hypothetical protein